MMNNMKMVQVVGVSLMALFILSVPLISFAQFGSGHPTSTGATSSITLENPLCDDSDDRCLLTVLTVIIQGLVALAIPVVGIMTLVGGFQMLFSGGDPAKFAAGRKTITYAVIGFLVVVFAQGVAGILESIFAP